MTTSDSEGAASGGELSEARIGELRECISHGLRANEPVTFTPDAPGWSLVRSDVVSELLDSHAARGERIKELEQEIAPLRAYYAHSGQFVDTCPVCVAVQAFYDAQQGQGGESGGNNEEDR